MTCDTTLTPKRTGASAEAHARSVERKGGRA